MKIALIGAVALTLVLGALFLLTGSITSLPTSTGSEGTTETPVVPSNPANSANDPFGSLKVN